MPRSRRSLDITDRYRDRLNRLTAASAAHVQRQWQTIDPADIDATHAAWLAATVLTLEQAQRAGITLTVAYLAAYLTSEQGRRAELPTVNPVGLVGVAENDAPLADPLSKTLVGTFAAMKAGKTPQEALSEQGNRAGRLAASSVAHAPREALAQQIAEHPDIVGWRRVTHGGCGACLASAAGGYSKHERMPVHPHCHCTQEPVIADVPDLAPRPTGPEVFHGMTVAQQDAALGPEAAQLVRQGRVSWPDLIARSPMEDQADYITQAVITAVEG